MNGSSAIVHVVNGDGTAAPLRAAGLGGRIEVWADTLDIGPLPVGGDATWRRSRASFLAGCGFGTAADVELQLAAWDQGVDAACACADELVLWYEHDLFDQLALMRLLARIATAARRPALALVSIDRHPDIVDFKGLGQLDPGQLAALAPRRIVLERDALIAGSAAWAALTARTPEPVAALCARGAGIPTLPFLDAALARWLEELPALGSGLGRTEAALLTAIAGGATELAAIMAAVHSAEQVYFASDGVLAFRIAELTRRGLIEDGRITALGEHCRIGARDRVAVAGIDEHRGGVHLQGHGPVWRWHPLEGVIKR